MTNKQKYPNAKVERNEYCNLYGGHYIRLDQGVFLKRDGSADSHSYSDPSNTYFESGKIAQSALDKFMKDKPEITLSEIKSQYEEAEKLLGKKFLSAHDGKTEICEKVFLAVKGGLNTSYLMDQEIEGKGYCIGITTAFRNTLPFSMCKKIKLIEVVAHDGKTYIAEDDGKCWKFGCAKISKTLIKESYKLLDSLFSDGNRQITKVTIGACDFDQETLKSLIEQDKS